MKRRIFLLLVVCFMVALVAGCSKESAKLTVYVVQEDALYDSAGLKYLQDYPDAELNVVYFETYDSVNEQLKTELLTGKGPDVLLFNSIYSDEDPYKLAAGGTLLALDEQVAGLSDKEYFGEILVAGRMNGHQYFVPLSWNILQVYSTQKTVEETGYSDDLYTAMLMKAEEVKVEENLGLSSLQTLRSDLMNFSMEIAGNEMFDVATGKLTDQKEEIQKIAEFLKIFYDDSAKRKEITAKYSNDFAGAVTHLSFLVENFSFVHNLRYYETLYPVYTGENMYFAPFTRQDGGVTAQVIQYGAINANTEKAEEAWAFLKYILDMPVSMSFAKYDLNTVYYAPVNVAAYESCVNAVSTQAGAGPKMSVNPLGDMYTQVLNDMPEQITEAVIPNVTYGALLQECMKPYLNGEDSFDNCYDTLVQRTKLYLSE